MKKETIRIDSLSTGYRLKREVRVVARNINASIHSGELTCLLGANGAGKSTLLRTLAAFQPPIDGSIRIMGRNIDEFSDKELSKAIGVVLTEKVDIRNMSVEDLVGLGRSPYTGFWGILDDTDRQVVRDALAMVKIEMLKDRMTDTLSDGERQKVMIAKVLAQQTPIIFLDEPTAFLDYPSKVEIMQLLHSLSRNENKTVFLSTHDLELALQIADKIWLMDKEKGVVIGTPEDLSYDGSLSSFFNRRGIVFDVGNGLFRIDNECSRSVCLTGNRKLFPLVRKALQRNGISTLTESTGCTDIEVNVSESDTGLEFTVKRDGKPDMNVSGINGLLESVQ